MASHDGYRPAIRARQDRPASLGEQGVEVRSLTWKTTRAYERYPSANEETEASPGSREGELKRRWPSAWASRAVPARFDTTTSAWPLQVWASGRYLLGQDGKPFHLNLEAACFLSVLPSSAYLYCRTSYLKRTSGHRGARRALSPEVEGQLPS